MNWLQKIAVSGPLIAYHATIAGSQIQQQGFKTREQLGGSALGGGTSQAVSFTTDWSVAKGIFDAFITMWEFANASDPLGMMQQHFQSIDAGVGAEIKQHIDGSQGNFDSALQGWKGSGWSSGQSRSMTNEELQQSGFRPRSENGVEQPPMDSERHLYWEEPMDQQEIDRLIYSYVNAYYTFAPVYNPLFFGTEVGNFRGIPRDSIGIVTAELFIDPERRGKDDVNSQGDYSVLPSMSEIRMYNLENIRQVIDFDSNPGDSPKMSSMTPTYQPDEKDHNDLNTIIKLLYKHQDIIRKGKVDFDYIVGILQGYTTNSDLRSFDDNPSLGQMRKYLFASLGIEYNDYDLLNYAKAKRKLEPPEEIRQAIETLPPDIRVQVDQGEIPFEDITDAWYGRNEVSFNQWTDGLQGRYIDQEIQWWMQDLKRYQEPYGEALVRLQKILGEQYSDVEFDGLAEIVKVFNDVVDSNRIANMDVTNWLQKQAQFEEGIPDILAGLANEARKYSSAEDFQRAFIGEIKHGMYWHITDDPNFFIDPERGPTDMSSMGGGTMSPGKLMITSDLETWAANYAPHRSYAALVDMSLVDPRQYAQVSRGFGNEL